MGKRRKKERERGMGLGGRGAWVLRRAGPHSNNARLTCMVFSFDHLQKEKQRKQRHPLKLGKKRRESFERNYLIISPRVIIKAMIKSKWEQEIIT